MIALLMEAALGVSRATLMKSPVRVAWSEARRIWVNSLRRLSIRSGVIFELMVSFYGCEVWFEPRYYVDHYSEDLNRRYRACAGNFSKATTRAVLRVSPKDAKRVGEAKWRALS